MKTRTFSRHLREAFKSLMRNGWMTFASVSAVTITLLLVGTFLMVIMNLNYFATKVEKDVDIRVHVDPAATQEDIDVLKTEIEAVSGVDTIEFSSKEEELEKLAEGFGETGSSIASMFEQDNPLKDVYIVKADEPRETGTVAKQIEKLDFVSSIQYGQGKVEKLFEAVAWGRWVGIGLIFGLLFTAMFLISNTIKITIYARKTEIEIMKLVGATNWFIRWPFLLEGLFIGVFGAMIPILLAALTYAPLVNIVNKNIAAAGDIFKLLPYSPFIFQLSALLLVVGGLIGMLGSVLSIRKFLKV